MNIKNLMILMGILFICSSISSSNPLIQLDKQFETIKNYVPVKAQITEQKPLHNNLKLKKEKLLIPVASPRF